MTVMHVLAATLISMSRQSVKLIAWLLAIAVLQAPIIVLCTGGSIEKFQTISASVGEWNSPQGRLFFALAAFAAFLNLVSMHTFLLSPPFSERVRVIGPCLDAVGDGIFASCRTPSSLPPSSWPLTQHGFIRFVWLTGQSLGLFLLATVSYQNPGGGLSPDVQIAQQIHNAGAAIAFLVSLVLEICVVLDTPRQYRSTSRLVSASLGIAFLVIFAATQAVGCTGLEPPEICPPPLGTISYVAESLMALAVAFNFFLVGWSADIDNLRAIARSEMQSETIADLIAARWEGTVKAATNMH